MPVPHQQFLHVPVLNPANPVPIKPGMSARVEFPAGEEIASGAQRPARKLRLKLSEPSAATGLRFSFNGGPLTDRQQPDGWLEFDLAGKTLRKGNNILEITAPAQPATALSLLDLYVAVSHNLRQD